ncbi:MAG: hypothetical protein SV910_01175 [Chloroflexota bacterium]|nr:hypothetical protein [Chloroflexota bacterium]
MTTRTQISVLLQAGRLTSPEPLLNDLDAIAGIEIDERRLDTSFVGGGGATFIDVKTAGNNANALADILHRHTKRLKDRGGDDLLLLIGGKIATSNKEVAFRDVRCERIVSLKDKSPDQIKEALEEGMVRVEG